MNILCIIANIPEKRWCVFLNSFKNYKKMSLLEKKIIRNI